MTVNYDVLANDYKAYRTPDVRIEAIIRRELKGFESLLNVGAGLGSYEPRHGEVIALEPSMEMIAKRPGGAAPAVQGPAESMPFADASFDVAMGILTLHHWQNLALGLAEMKRVARDKIVLLTWIDDSPRFWMEDYFPEMRDIDRKIFPTLKTLEAHLGNLRAEIVPIPADCTDGFMGAYWSRPEKYLDAGVRSAISTFARLANPPQGIEALRKDIESGAWHQKYGELKSRNTTDLGYRLVVSEKNACPSEGCRGRIAARSVCTY